MSEADYLAYYAKKAVLITGGLASSARTWRGVWSTWADVTLADSLIPDYGGNLFNVAAMRSGCVNIADADPYSMRAGAGAGRDL